MQGVSAVRGGRALFAGIDLMLAQGGAALVSGPNGSGKTSLLRIAAGLLPPAAGTVARSGRAAWLGEAAALDDEQSLTAALTTWAQLDGIGEVTARVARGLDAVGLGEVGAVPVRFLSTGQRRRAALARVVAGGAPLWLLDEPGNGLDAAAQRDLATAIAAHRAQGGAIFVATHQPLDLPGADKVQLG